MAITTQDPVFGQLLAWTNEIGVDLLLGFLKREGETLYSFCALLSGGAILHLYRRISRGWKVYWETDAHYCEGQTVEPFDYRGKRCLIAICGDLWDFPERFRQNQDLLFWLVYLNFTVEQWQTTYEAEYIRQAAQADGDVLLCNSISQPPDLEAFGGCYWFVAGKIRRALPMGSEGLLLLDL